MKDFRINAPQVQYSLLKRPAKKAYIKLHPPKEVPKKYVIFRPQPPEEEPKSEVKVETIFPTYGSISEALSKEEKAYELVITTEYVEVTVMEKGKPKKVKISALADCDLSARVITCKGRRYELQVNQPNSKLREGALAKENRMEMPVYGGDLTDSKALEKYLFSSYHH